MYLRIIFFLIINAGICPETKNNSMMRQRTILILLCSVINFLYSPAIMQMHAQEGFSVRNFTKQMYRAENQNWSITGDGHGYIYAANNIGLLEFDGVEWSFYPSPKGTVIRSVVVDPSGRIYTGGYRELGYWERNSLGNLTYHSLNQIAESRFSTNEEFWTNLLTPDRIFFHSFTSVFILENDSFQIISPGDNISSMGAFNEKVLLHVGRRGIYSVEENVLSPFITDEVIRNTQVRFMINDGNQSLLIGTAADGIFRYASGILSPYLPEWKEYFSKNEINRGTLMKDGRLVIGTILDGISIFSPEGKLEYRINTKTGLQNNTVLGIYNDEFNNLWISLDRGIDFISLQTDSSYSFIPAVEAGSVYSAALYRNSLYLGTNQGVYRSPDIRGHGSFELLEGTQGQTWNCNVFDDQLFISHNNGTFLLDGESNVVRRISSIGGGFSLISNPVNEQSLIQSTYSNIVFYKKKPKGWNYERALNGFSNLIRYIEIDHLNNLWASHMRKGVFRLRLNERQDSILEEEYFGNETFGKDFNLQVFQFEKRVVFTTGRMIYTYDDINDTIIPFSFLNEMTGEYAASHRIVNGPGNHYWFICNKGIALFKYEKNRLEKLREYPAGLFSEHLIIGYENLIPLDEFTGLLCLDNGFALLNAGQGDLSKSISNKRLRLKSLEISDYRGETQNINPDNLNIRIPFKRNSLLMTYSFPMYSDEQIMFQSFVDGMDTGWSKSVANPLFSFKRLPPGEYTINVRAHNRWGEFSPMHSINITILRPWYFSRISFLAYLVILTAAVLIFRRSLLARIRLREQKIRDAKERELIRLRNEKLNSELSYKSQELANSTMAIIKKNEFLLELKEILKTQKEDLGLRYPDKYYQRLIRKIDTNISSVDDWKVFETHFERAHEKFLHNLMSSFPQLSPSDLRLCAYLRMNLSSKEIAPLLKISVRGVENHRYKLRKKLYLKPEENLIDFILGL